MLFASVPIQAWGMALAVLILLMLLNELARFNKWTGLSIFIILPIVLTVFVWPTTSGPSSGASTANWFQWAKVYSALAGCIIFWGLRFFPKVQKLKWYYVLPPAILAINIMEAVVREFEIMGMEETVIDGMTYIGGGWNFFNSIAGILNILTICGWYGIIISKGRQRDMIWPDMMWFWIIAYDLWNFAYLYNVVTDRAVYGGLVLLLSCTIPAFFIKPGSWLQARAATLAIWMMIVMTFPNFFTEGQYAIHSTHNPTMYWIVSMLAFISNVAVAVYQVRMIVKTRRNPIRGELYTDSRSYKKIYSDNIDVEGIPSPAALAYPEIEKKKHLKR
ncbi:DUF5692 family protein [Boudabousia marimammalium]|uniref:Uncharacterized protein n=1 Tax=Boudabousia marimammalium TaxID=156892 RepID=A0A1Q5PK05_9ACTO|nr:DUF5692 family protein [Boudabousia marimammalium]OKL46239.1 hypothetical protein BM477_07355 [Boudabousia marimammalium]